MKSSIVLASLCATAALAGPFKRGLHTEWVYETVTVTVTGGAEPTSTPLPTETPAVAPGQFFDAGESTVNSVVPEPSPEPEPQPEPEPEPSPSPEPEPDNSVIPIVDTPPLLPEMTGDYQNDVLAAHNAHRANHSVDALTWSTDLASRAYKIAAGCSGEHQMNEGLNDYGQNLQTGSVPADVPGAVSKSWYNNEMPNYAGYYGEEPPISELGSYGHFTAMVWAGTKEVGCATYQCPHLGVGGDNVWWTVCNYRPVGNMMGAWSKNVFKPNGAATLAA